MFEELSKHLQDLILPLDFITERAARDLIFLTAQGIINEAGKENIDIYLLDEFIPLLIYEPRYASLQSRATH